MLPKVVQARPVAGGSRTQSDLPRQFIEGSADIAAVQTLAPA